MSKDMKPGLDLPNLFEQSCAPEVEVQVISRGRVGDQDIRFEGNAILPWCFYPRILESAKKLGIKSGSGKGTHAKSDPPHIGISGEP